MNAAKITRQSKSNLALAFVSLGRERRRDITTFYAFCRVIDDIADDPALAVGEKKRGLELWRLALRSPQPNEPSLAPEIRELIKKYSLTPEMLEEIIAGVEMDLTTVRYATFDDLRVYCYRVASAVGLVSIEIFGYRNPLCKEYAVELGLALQTTNIIRDVNKDLRQGRIYLPREDMERFHYSEAELLAAASPSKGGLTTASLSGGGQDRQYNARFVELMEFEAGRAEQFFARAAELLPPEDRQSMVAAEIMASIYHAILRRMKADRFRVFEKDYGLTKLAKARHIATQLLRSCIRIPD